MQNNNKIKVPAIYPFTGNSYVYPMVSCQALFNIIFSKKTKHNILQEYIYSLSLYIYICLRQHSRPGQLYEYSYIVSNDFSVCHMCGEKQPQFHPFFFQFVYDNPLVKSGPHPADNNNGIPSGHAAPLPTRPAASQPLSFSSARTTRMDTTRYRRRLRNNKRWICLQQRHRTARFHPWEYFPHTALAHYNLLLHTPRSCDRGKTRLSVFLFLCIRI